MKINNTVKRLTLFFLAFPLLGAMIFLLPHYNHLVTNIVVMITTILSTRELSQMFAQAGFKIKVNLFSFLGALFPLTQYLIVRGYLQDTHMVLLMVILASFIIIYPVFQKTKENVTQMVKAVPVALLLLIYPGLFFSYIVRYSLFPQASYFLFFLILLVYMNDSNAWMWGVLWGKRRNIFAVSPNKSIAGFMGGFFASFLISFVFILFLPRFVDGLEPGSALLATAIALVCGFTTIMGDLVESGLKRFTQVKDSGTMIMGRGGLLDSVDSLLLTAPLFYYFICLYLGIEF